MFETITANIHFRFRCGFASGAKTMKDFYRRKLSYWLFDLVVVSRTSARGASVQCVFTRVTSEAHATYVLKQRYKATRK